MLKRGKAKLEVVGNKICPDLEVTNNTLSLLGLERISVEHIVEDKHLFQALEELHQYDNDVVHSWKNFELKSKKDVFEKLKEFEERKRPTQFFFYYGYPEKGERELIGCGTVAEKISNSFPHEGFPVIARAWIRPKFRNNRTYYPILKSRIQYCLNRWGEDLKGIHLGTANNRVFQTLKFDLNKDKFYYMGNEHYKENKYIRGFLYLTNDYRRSIQDALIEKSDEIPENKKLAYAQLANIVFKFLANQFDETTFYYMSKYIYIIGKNIIPHEVLVLNDIFEEIPIIKSNTAFDRLFMEPLLLLKKRSS